VAPVLPAAADVTRFLASGSSAEAPDADPSPITLKRDTIAAFEIGSLPLWRILNS
jgi:hypothetical protein